MAKGSIVPVTCGSAVRAIGVDRLATLVDEIAESRPIPAIESGDEVMLARDPEADLVLRAFKVIVDPYVGRIVVMEVIAGTVTAEVTLANTRSRSEEKLHGLNYLFGSKLVAIDKAFAGDVVAVAKLNNVVDPSLRVRHDPVSRRLAIDVMGDLHLMVTLERLRRRFNVEVTTAPPSVQLFETIVKPREIEGRLKKQTGGHGQFAVVNMKVEPLEPTAPLEFVDAVVGGAVPRQYIGAVRNGVEKAMAHGGPEGHPVVGLRVTLLDGKHHAVDSSEAAFETAASMAVRSALGEARYLGDVLNDLSGRRGRVIGTTQDDDMSVTVTAHVPEAQLHRYGLDLRSMTSGLGRASIEPHHLAEVPKTATTKTAATKTAVGH